jgi:WD40 repeat protein
VNFKSTVIFLGVLVLTSCSDTPPEEVVVHDSRGLFAASFDIKADKVLIATVDNSAQLWSTSPSIQLFKWTHSEKSNTDISHAKLSDDGKIAVTAAGNVLAIWDAVNGENIGYWKLKSHITGISVTSEGKYILVSFANRVVQIVDSKDGHSVWQVENSGYIQSIDISGDGKLAVIGDDDKYITMWDIENSRKLFSHELNTRPRYLKISPSNRYTILSSSLQPIKLLDSRTGNVIKEFTKYSGVLGKFGNANYSVLSSRFNRTESKVLVGAPPKNLYLWDIETGAMSKSWTIPKDTFWKPSTPLIYSVAFDSDETSVYCETSNAKGYKWNIN